MEFIFQHYFTATFILAQVLSEGEVSLHIQSYNNPASRSLTGEVCAGQCVNTFTITLHTRVRVGDGSLLDEIKQVQSNDNIGDVESFSSTLGTLWDNPLVIEFAGEVRLKFSLTVSGVEKNYPNNEYKMAEFNFNQTGKFSDTITLRSGSASLAFRYNASCTVHYYNNCDRKCIPRDNESGHYTCNSTTGHVVCLQGWTGVNCNSPHGSVGTVPPIVTEQIVTDNGKTNDTGSRNDTSSNKGDTASNTGKSSKLEIDMNFVWKVAAICAGVVIGTIVVALWVWYETRYKKKRSKMPKIVVSNEKLFEKTGNFPIEPSAPGEEALSDVSGSLNNQPRHSRNNLTSSSIPNLNNNSTPPPVEQPEWRDEP